MSKKTTFESLFDSGKEVLSQAGKTTEQFIEDKTGTSIDFFTEEKEIEQKNEKGKQKIEITTREEIDEIRKQINFQKSEILTKVKNGLKNGFEKLKSKIPEKYLQTLEEKYNSIMKKLEKCKNDKDLDEIYTDIKLEIGTWITELSKEKKGFSIESIYSIGTGLDKIKQETITGLANLQEELARFGGKNEYEQTKKETNQLQKKQKKDSGVESMLTKIGIPASIAGIFAGFLTMLGIKGGDSKKDGFLNTIFTFIKNPIDGFKNLVGLENKEISEQEEIITKGDIKENGEFVTYTNTNIKIKTKNKSIEDIKINGKNYKINLENIGEVTFMQKNGKDYIVIKNKKIDLFTFIKKIKEDKDEYILSQNFDNGNNLKLEIKT